MAQDFSGAVLPVRPKSLLSRLLRSPAAIVSVSIFATILILSALVSVLSPWDPYTAMPSQVLLPPGGEHLLGTDSAGRDVATRLLVGARVTLVGAFLTILVAYAVGVPAGVIAGYFGGRVETVLSWLSDLVQATPTLVMVIAFITMIGPGTYEVMILFGFLFSPGPYRLSRNGARAVSKELYIDAAKVSGLGDLRIMVRHVLRLVRSPLFIQASITVGVAIILQAGLDFLGIGDPRVASWGQMLNDGFLNIYRSPLMIIWPGVAIGLTVGAFVIFGTALRDALERVATSSDRSANEVESRPVAEPILKHDSAGESESPVILEVNDLWISYKNKGGPRKHVVRGVSLQVCEGQVLGIVGESGSGKSQTAFAALGLLPQEAQVSSGEMVFAGNRYPLTGKLDKIAHLRGLGIGYIPQEPISNLDPSFTLGFQLMEPMKRLLKINSTAAKERAAELLLRVGINDPLRTLSLYPHEVSGGMAQRVLIAGAVSCNPRLLVADEPTTALDVTVQAEVLALLRGLQQEHKMGMLLITHDFGVVADICDRVAVMREGALLEEGSVREIFETPLHPYTKLLLDSTLEDTESRLELDSIHSQGQPQ